MQLPKVEAHFTARVHFGRYVGRRLKRARLTTYLPAVEKVTGDVRAAGRANEDAEDEIQDALADRDAASDELDAIAQDARVRMAGRGIEAVRTTPYTDVFPDGVAYYTKVPLDEKEQRQGLLKMRLVAHLPADDEVRVKAVPAVEQGLERFGEGTAAVTAARAKAEMAASRVAAAVEVFDRQMEKVYGALVSELGRAGAEMFFPRNRKPSRKDDGENAKKPK